MTSTASFGIIGYPLGHSLSPALHNWVYRKIGLAAVYQAWPTPPEELEAFIRSLQGSPVRGVSVTIPHKQAIIKYLDELTPFAAQVGAVNTLFWEGNALCGANTDAPGFLAPLLERKFHPQTVLLLGAGGAARAVLAALCSLSPCPRIFIAARNPDQAQTLSADFKAQAIPWTERAALQADLAVNATPMGMSGGPAPNASPLVPEDFRALGRENCLACDLVYNPLQTPFLQAAQSAGWQVQDGLDMLIAQALEQIRLWSGVKELPGRPQIRQMLVQAGLLT